MRQSASTYEVVVLFSLNPFWLICSKGVKFMSKSVENHPVVHLGNHRAEADSSVVVRLSEVSRFEDGNDGDDCPMPRKFPVHEGFVRDVEYQIINDYPF